jgi:uncharacterized phiE125 gp8 family phage protein
MRQLKLEEDELTVDQKNDLNSLISAAREWCEEYQNRAYISQEFEIALDCFPAEAIRLPRPPLINVETVKYLGADDALHTLTNGYTVDDYSQPARVYIANKPSDSKSSVNSLRVRYKAGYGTTASNVPEKVKQAIMILTVHWYLNGRCEPPEAVKYLLAGERVVGLHYVT